MNSAIYPFDQVITLAEAAALWHYDRKTIIWAYWNGHINMRQSGKVWLVDVQSLIDHFGQPVDPEHIPISG